ncbi:MAG TPA: hypothetical protein VFS43_27880 [Polyangiaceae bacterium]|nr:hypothetical protein [Polyangiaceae bacterium]
MTARPRSDRAAAPERAPASARPRRAASRPPSTGEGDAPFAADYARLCALRDELGALLGRRPLPTLPDAVARFEWAGALHDIALAAWRARGREADTVEEQALSRALGAPPGGGRR